MGRTIQHTLPHRVPLDARLSVSGERRAQADRSATMRQKILDATLACLTERGFAYTSIDDVIRRAGVSRGALGHHFPTKADLIATAIWQNTKTQFELVAERLDKAIADHRPLGDQLRLAWARTEQTFALNAEFWLATRGNPDLRVSYERAQAADPNLIANIAPVEWVRARDDPSPLLTRYVVGCFINGLCYAAQFNDRATLEATFNKFVDLLALGLNGMGGVVDQPSAR